MPPHLLSLPLGEHFSLSPDSLSGAGSTEIKVGDTCMKPGKSKCFIPGGAVVVQD